MNKKNFLSYCILFSFFLANAGEAHFGPPCEIFDTSPCKCLHLYINGDANRRSQVAEWPRGDFLISRERFLQEAAAAHQADPSIYAPVQREPLAYRVDRRSPREIIESGGFFGNLLKPEGGIEDHVKPYSTGTRNFVSFSFEQSTSVILHEDFLPKSASGMIYKGKLARQLRTNDWGRVRSKRWPVNTPIEDLPQALVFESYQYRVKNVEGVRIIGGLLAREKELTTRGVDISNHDIEWRLILISKTLSYKVEKFDGVDYLVVINGDGLGTDEKTSLADENFLELVPWRKLEKGSE
jgi:hypothetical protein